MKTVQTTVLILIGALAFSACGKKGDLEQPEKNSSLLSAEIQLRG